MNNWIFNIKLTFTFGDIFPKLLTKQFINYVEYPTLELAGKTQQPHTNMQRNEWMESREIKEVSYWQFYSYSGLQCAYTTIM